MSASIALAFVFACSGARGQGTILFQNVGPGLNAPVFNPEGTAKLAGDRYKVELLVGHTPTSLTPVATTSFSSIPSAAGLFLGGIVTLPGHPGGSSPFILVRFWDSNTGATYDMATSRLLTAVFQLGARLGDPNATPPTPPPSLIGMTSAAIPRPTPDPEPSTIVFVLAGGTALLLWRRLRFNNERPDAHEN